METPDFPKPYQLVYSDAVKLRLREMADEAYARGDGPAFTAALKEFDRRLRLYPQFGDPQVNLTAQVGFMYQGIIRPLSMRYGVLEERRIVLCTVLPVLMAMDKPNPSEHQGP